MLSASLINTLLFTPAPEFIYSPLIMLLSGPQRGQRNSRNSGPECLWKWEMWQRQMYCNENKCKLVQNQRRLGQKREVLYEIPKGFLRLVYFWGLKLNW